MTSDETKIDTDQLRTIANAIGQIAQDTSAFTTLQNDNPWAGKFDAALWMNDIYADRRDAIYQHGMDLKQTFHDMSVHLNNIADDADNTDQSNGDSVSSLDSQIDTEISGLKSDVGNDVSNPVKGVAGGPNGGKYGYQSGDDTHAGDDTSNTTLNSDGTATINDSQLSTVAGVDLGKKVSESTAEGT